MTRTGLFRQQRLLALLSACALLPAVTLQSIKTVDQFIIVKLRVKLLGGKKKMDTSILHHCLQSGYSYPSVKDKWTV